MNKSIAEKKALVLAHPRLPGFLAGQHPFSRMLTETLLDTGVTYRLLHLADEAPDLEEWTTLAQILIHGDPLKLDLLTEACLDALLEMLEPENEFPEHFDDEWA